MTRRGRSALAGAAAATVWALQEPLDKRVFRCPYSDVALLGKAATQGRWWRPLGLAAHAGNGALAGLAFEALSKRSPRQTRRNALLFALAEHAATYPLTLLSDRFHPARGAPELPPLARSGRGFLQATWRHVVFGLVLGALLRDGTETGP